MYKKAIKRGLILGVFIVLISLVGMGIIDFVVFGILALLVIIAAGVATIAHNQRVDSTPEPEPVPVPPDLPAYEQFYNLDGVWYTNPNYDPSVPKPERPIVYGLDDDEEEEEEEDE